MGTKCTAFITVVRVLTVILATATLGAGLYSHFDSAWNKLDGRKTWKHEVVCELMGKNPELYCPPLAMEQFYVSIIILAFILSILGLVTSGIDVESVPFNIIDFLYHALFFILLLTASGMYMISALLIDQVYEKLFGDDYDVASLKSYEKFVAGRMTLIHSGLYFIMMLLIGIQALMSKSRAPTT